MQVRKSTPQKHTYAWVKLVTTATYSVCKMVPTSQGNTGRN